MRGNTFKVDLGFADRLNKKFGQASETYNKLMQKRMIRATDMVWRIAHQKRPLISKAAMKATGRRIRVSDPTAELGVPVRTGALQASIVQRVTKKGNFGWIGTVMTKGIRYAGYIEYGTFKMAARPFMRPAVNLTKDAIKRMFGLKVSGNFSGGNPE